MTDYHEAIPNKPDLCNLTGLRTKGYFANFLDGEIAMYSRNRDPLTLMIFEIDHFTRLKNAYGHIIGDVLPVDLVARIRPRILPGQLFARNDEAVFTCVLPSTAQLDGIVFAEHLRTIIEERPCSFAEHLRKRGEQLSFDLVSYTISIGVTTLHGESGIDRPALIKRAEDNLNIAKRNHNRVVPSLADLVPV
jgi:diguanylate cyclase